MTNAPGKIRYYVRVVKRQEPALSQLGLALKLDKAPNTIPRLINGKSIQPGTFKALEEIATATLQNYGQWRHWPEGWQQEAFALHRAMDRFDKQDPVQVERHRVWTNTIRNYLEHMLGYATTMETPPSDKENRTMDRACYAQLLAWAYTDLAQMYASKTPEGAEQRRRWFERARHCYQFAADILGEHGKTYLQARAKYALIGAYLSEVPLGTAEKSAKVRQKLEAPEVAEMLRTLMEEPFDYHVRYQALVYASVRNDKDACNAAYSELCDVHPGFERWSFVPDATLPCILSNADMRFFRSFAKELATNPKTDFATTTEGE